MPDRRRLGDLFTFCNLLASKIYRNHQSFKVYSDLGRRMERSEWGHMGVSSPGFIPHFSVSLLMYKL